ncbi:unnamed protein product [Calypogeia fissa]
MTGRADVAGRESYFQIRTSFIPLRPAYTLSPLICLLASLESSPHRRRFENNERWWRSCFHSWAFDV